MEIIQQLLYQESSMPFSDGRGVFIGSCSMLQTPIHHLTYCLKIDVTL